VSSCLSPSGDPPGNSCNLVKRCMFLTNSRSSALFLHHLIWFSYVVLVNDSNSNSGHSVSSTHVVQPQACHFTNLLVLFETGRQEFCQHGYIQSYRLDFKAHGLYMHQGALDCQILPFTITLPILF
jgi:hypothetical protein